MYTVVLMAAMTAGEAAPTWGHHGGCYGGCHGCWGGCASCGGGCYGGCGCWNYNCACYGGGAPFMGMFCHGGYGCHGYGYMTGCYGAYGYGGGYGGLSTMCTGCYGCYGGHACYGMTTNVAAPVPGETPKMTPVPPAPAPGPMESRLRSKVIIETPEDAKLYVDGQLMKTGSARRVFQTPDLVVGSTYFYDVKIEYVRDGKTIREEQRIVVRPGQEASIAFRDTGSRPDLASVRAGE
jgi:uncharacterized protein (TIGR03000 family)